MNGVINASDRELVRSAESYERAAELGAIAVLGGLILEVVLAARHALPDAGTGSAYRSWDRLRSGF